MFCGIITYMKYSVGYQQNSEWIEAIVKNRAAVYECYFSYRNTGARGCVSDMDGSAGVCTGASSMLVAAKSGRIIFAS